MRLRRELNSGKLEGIEGKAPVTLLFEDGVAYDKTGTLQFTDARVDPTTGTLSLRALFPNPDGTLLPGMYLRVRIEEATRPRALLIPQSSVSRDKQGTAIALFVNAKNSVERRRITVDRAVGNAWLLTGGAAAGDRVIVAGQNKIHPGEAVVPVSKEKSPPPEK
jgi:membrane fusion protein (multidrug efflux system)